MTHDTQWQQKHWKPWHRVTGVRLSSWGRRSTENPHKDTTIAIDPTYLGIYNQVQLQGKTGSKYKLAYITGKG